MAELIDFEYDSKDVLIAVLINDDGDIEEFDRVRHGQWLRMDDTFTKWECSACGSKYHDMCTKFCSHCGARMGGGVADAV